MIKSIPQFEEEAAILVEVLKINPSEKWKVELALRTFFAAGLAMAANGCEYVGKSLLKVENPTTETHVSSEVLLETAEQIKDLVAIALGTKKPETSGGNGWMS